MAAQSSSTSSSAPKLIVIQLQKIIVEKNHNKKDIKGLKQGINNIFKNQRQK
uniref:Uncharacterized protein n=1 Tax=Marseillevirus sp. TaxID=2809551 RepID=A0AA96IYM2_9VIRU|nr:hypothetical protein MarFTMF_133 [Marseillevirus sp.]